MIETIHTNKMPRFTCYFEPMLLLPNYIHIMYELKMPAKYWDVIST